MAEAPLSMLFLASIAAMAKFGQSRSIVFYRCLFSNSSSKGCIAYSDTWRGYTGIAIKGYVYRLVKLRKSSFVAKRNHINCLESFWGCLKRKLAAKGPRALSDRKGYTYTLANISGDIIIETLVSKKIKSLNEGIKQVYRSG